MNTKNPIPIVHNISKNYFNLQQILLETKNYSSQVKAKKITQLIFY